MSAIARALPPSECLHIYVHGFGVGPAGAKFKFAQQYLKSHELHAPAWHVPTFAETRLSHSIAVVEQYMLQMSAACSGKPWNAIGSSTGALILTHISQKHPHLIHRMLLISPAVHLADWFEKQGQLHAWSDDAPGAADAFMPNNTGDNSGSLRYEFLRDARLHGVGSMVAPNAPTFVVHAAMDELVPVADSRQFCDTHALSRGGSVHEYMELPPHDDRGDAHTHTLYHWSKPDAACNRSFEAVMKEWFILNP